MEAIGTFHDPFLPMQFVQFADVYVDREFYSIAFYSVAYTLHQIFF
jgi:hypothetical protein